jgi:DNA polymerase-3 subunit alpha
VAQIITFGTLAARQVVRDVGRVFGLPDYRLEQVANILRSFGPGKQQLTNVIHQSQPLRNLMADDSLMRLLIQVAEKLEGLPRHYSTHAAGVVLSAKPLLDVVPLQQGNDPAGLLMTQFEKGTVEALGLLKMDFLGLRNLSIMDDALKLIHQTQPDFDVTKISLNDPQTLALFRQAQTDGIFQFESAGIRRTLKELSPTNFEDIVAVNALYRPGPMENIPTFLARRHGQEKVQLPDASLAPILGPTYGILVYQEQVMQVASVMAGFTMGQADLLRRAMSKKKQTTMASMRQRFMTGALANGYSRSVAEQVFDYIDRFANYGFNRSHAVAYSKMAFEMAYLKAHFTAAFYTALLSIEPNFEKEQQHFTAAKQLGVKILPPNINQSQAAFSLSNGQIITGFTMIKGMRRDFMAAIVKGRQEKPYQDLADFVRRIDPQFQKANLIAPLIYVGAFDKMGYNRAEMIAGLDGLVESSEFSFQSADLQPVMEQRNEYPLSYRLAKEREYLGLYLSGHPVSQYANLRAKIQALPIAQLKPQERVRVILMVNQVRHINTKRTHEPMAFVSGSDESGTLEVTIFPQYLRQCDPLLKAHAILVFTGNTELRNGKLQLLARTCTPIDQVMQQNTKQQKRWVIRLVNHDVLVKGQEFIRQLAAKQTGDIPVVLFDVKSQQATRLADKYNLQTNELVQQSLNHYFGNDNVVLQTL